MKRSKRLVQLRAILKALNVRCSWIGSNGLSVNYEGLEIFFTEDDEDYMKVSFWRVPDLTFFIYGESGADLFMNSKRNKIFDQKKIYAFAARAFRSVA
jgi:hypothetical protein